mmetsp:Transcript_40446/g.66262  ORF Transcript_40446/g.66262 Transcript_40446/m.66262 type:complete len:185 (-) Transcript_40446:12-566(-)|eukprot:CAMPEP_0201977178 /NCGR_PEP_ID=MMETSP0904-20121228/59792_1 /ASSEMBLY_ACC=CAM_ASM_000553 /TAXON_ID=420261 /ORGANISM="Thalassiosira antarctica, Strain CCMP982" /LENGTH=184 /DNA_ID=CAMNT_0048528481 /DNA_START=126 /DNA_END=680 /DNA_ORIENTATION=-
MSDLARFVAAALHDKAMHELIKENESLREKVQLLNSMEITGRGGQHVYARGCLESGKYSENQKRWNVQLEQVQPLSAKDIKTAQIWTGGIWQGSFHDADVRIFTDPSRNGVLSRFKFRTCDVFVLTEWAHKPHDLHETVSRLSGDNYALLNFLSQADPNKRHRFLGSSWSVSENKKRLAIVLDP